MSWWAQLKRVLRREAAGARDVKEELEQKLDAALDRREREMNADPVAKLDLATEQASRTDAEFDEVARRIEAKRPAQDADTRTTDTP